MMDEISKTTPLAEGVDVNPANGSKKGAVML
jgi:hypothetical protein